MPTIRAQLAVWCLSPRPVPIWQDSRGSGASIVANVWLFIGRAPGAQPFRPAPPRVALGSLSHIRLWVNREGVQDSMQGFTGCVSGWNTHPSPHSTVSVRDTSNGDSWTLAGQEPSLVPRAEGIFWGKKIAHGGGGVPRPAEPTPASPSAPPWHPWAPPP